MHSVSDLYLTLLADRNHRVETKLSIAGVEYSQADIVKNSLRVYGGLYSTFGIGNCSAVVIVPADIVYWIVVSASPAVIIGGILLTIQISLIVLIMSCVLGWCVAKVSLKLKNRSFVSVAVSYRF